MLGQSKQNWTLGNAQERAAAAPYTFHMPSKEAIALLRPGDHAKLIFELAAPHPNGPGAERMWVEITVTTKWGFVGILDNVPQDVENLSLGSTVEFEPHHIIAVSIPDPVPSSTDRWLARCVVTKSILSDRKRVTYLYREQPIREEDSGWRLTASEDAMHLNDPENFSIVSLGAVLNCDDRMLALLDRRAPVAFEWNDEREDFVEIAPQTSIN